jgi:hypothetical protein
MISREIRLKGIIKDIRASMEESPGEIYTRLVDERLTDIIKIYCKELDIVFYNYGNKNYNLDRDLRRLLFEYGTKGEDK